MKNIDSLKRKVDLKKFSHIKVGGFADVYFPKNFSDIADIYKFFPNKIKFPIGGGSNILFSNKVDKILISDKYLPKKMEISENIVTVSSNYNINEFIMKMAKEDLGGLEFLSGIPANLGGLTFMNAGAYQKEISEFITSVLLIDEYGELKLLNRDDINFQYRESGLKGYILEISFKLKNKNKNDIRRKIFGYIGNRKLKQPLNMPNLGSFFKNPPNVSAGKLIDECGLKGINFGGAEISEKHANFIINSGNANFRDIICLTELIKEKVINRFQIKLELEIKIV